MRSDAERYPGLASRPSGGAARARSSVAMTAAAAAAAGLIVAASAAQPDPEPNGQPPAPGSAPTEEAGPGPGTDPEGDPAGATGEEPDGARPVGEKAATPQAGDDVLLVYRSGERYEAVYVESSGLRHRVRLGGIVIEVRPGDLERIVVLPSATERLRQMRAVIDDDDADGLVSLGEWAVRKRLFEEAAAVFGEALEADPFHPRAEPLRAQAERLAVLAERSRSAEERRSEEERERAREREEDGRGESEEPRGWQEVGGFPLLDERQINLLKVYEVDLDDPPRLEIDRATVEQFVSAYGGHPLVPEDPAAREAFLRRDAAEVLDVMFRVGAREFYDRVRVDGQPSSMRLFRDRVNAGWLVNSCAATRCHGGREAGRFMLYNRRPNAERAFYTNFLIVERFETSDGRRLIDYDEPADSLLLQMGLSPNEARTTHPPVRGWRPIFRSEGDRGFVRTLEWIESMYRPRPEHPIEYEGPEAALEERGVGGGEPEPVER